MPNEFVEVTPIGTFKVSFFERENPNHRYANEPPYRVSASVRCEEATVNGIKYDVFLSDYKVTKMYDRDNNLLPEVWRPNYFNIRRADYFGKVTEAAQRRIIDTASELVNRLATPENSLDARIESMKQRIEAKSAEIKKQNELLTKLSNEYFDLGHELNELKKEAASND